MRARTRPFGEIEIDDRQIIEFPHGVFGFEHHRRYALLDSPQPPFYWLQSLDQPEIAFVLINPYVFRPDYVLQVADEDIEELEYESDDDILVFAIVTIPENPQEMTANLQGPVIINRKTRLGRQSISLDQRWTTKHCIVEEMELARDKLC
jgi:flagellar assembly factor FliW